LSEKEKLFLIVDTIADGIKTTSRDLYRSWKLYLSLHLRRCRLEHEAEMLALSIGEAESRGRSVELDEMRSKAQSLGNEVRFIRGELDKLDEKLVYLGGCRDGFIKYLEDIDSTFQSLTTLSEP
jgi:hypothetical protein